MEYMHELKEMLCEELEKIAREGELTAGSLDTVDKLTHSIKSIATIMAMEDSGYSRDYVDKYRGASYAQRRDSMGRYSIDGLALCMGSSLPISLSRSSRQRKGKMPRGFAPPSRIFRQSSSNLSSGPSRT